jgi:hypothetical protein
MTRISWLLILHGPDMCVEYYTMDEFLTRYVPRMNQFLRQLEQVESESILAGGPEEQPCLSTMMRDSWKTGRFWFNYAARTSLDIDDISSQDVPLYHLFETSTTINLAMVAMIGFIVTKPVLDQIYVLRSYFDAPPSAVYVPTDFTPYVLLLIRNLAQLLIMSFLQRTDDEETEWTLHPSFSYLLKCS